ncbi:MAG: transporter substrate-binding domain-containing protein [Candidatus Obscuribacterales bacterium]|nr:transporter substrate-binding domain-containing protein [Candidatus Obscuribacterales bacterium]
MPEPRNIVVMFFAVCLFLTGCAAGELRKPESAMDRVLKSGKIRCSYLPYSSYFRKDPNTGELSGIFYDIMEEIGKNSNLKIEWTEEVGYENIFPGLNADRYDVFAAGLWPNASRAKAALFTGPAFYSPITIWVRPDDHRFDSSISTINSPAVKIASIDGAMEDIIAKTNFPKAQLVSLPELSVFSQNLLNVTHKKADLTFAEPLVVEEFLSGNPGALRQIKPDEPLRIFGSSLAVKRDEIGLKEFLDVALKEIIDNGKIKNILTKYRIQSGTFYPVAHSYSMPERRPHE